MADPTTGAVLLAVADHLHQHGRGRSFNSLQSFQDIGLKPLDFIEVVMDLEAKLQIEIPDEVAVPCRTPRDLAAAIDRIRT